MPRTPLDSVVRVREWSEAKAAEELKRRRDEQALAQARLQQAVQRARTDFRARGDVSSWQLAELAQHRALAEVKQAERQVEQHVSLTQVALSAYSGAYREAEVVRRAAQSHREAAARELDRREQRELDELAVQRHRARVG